MKRLFRNLTLSQPRSDYAAAGDFMRVFSIAFVAWYHIWQQSWLAPQLKAGVLSLDLSPQVRAGYMFVDLMLLLSGFLLYLPYANDRERPAGEFYMKRAIRILPSYWFCLAVMVLFAVFTPDFTDPSRLMKDLLAHLSFTQNFFLFSYTATRLNVVLWTLAVEVQFYVLLPLIAPAFRRRPALCYLVMTGAALAFRNLWTAPMEDTTLFVNRLPNMLDVYANGMLAAHLYARLARETRRRGWIAALGTAAMLAAGWAIWRIVQEQARAYDYEVLRQGQMDHRWLFSCCGALFLLGGSLSFAPVRALLSNRLVRFLSGVSFNFYIWHQWLAVKLKAWRIPGYTAESNPNMAGEMPWQLHYSLACFAFAFLAAVAVTYLIEKPCANAGRKLLRRFHHRKTKG